MAYMGLARRRPRIPPLILVGPGSHWAQGGSIMGPQIRATGYLETREIRALMAASAALVLPSLEEGFGLPVAEAMAAGLPVVCSRGSALEEVAGGAATLVNPLDTALHRRRHGAAPRRPRAWRSEQRQRGPRAEPRASTGTRGRARPSSSTAASSVRDRWRPRGSDRHRRPRAAGAAHGHRPLPAQPAARGSRAEGTAWSSTSTAAPPEDPVLAAPGVVVRSLGSGRAAGSGWRSGSSCPRRAVDGLDVFFSPAYVCPLRLPLPRVTTVHDLSFFACPEDFTVLDGLRRRLLAGASLRASAAVLACSDFTRREILRLLPRGGRPRPPRPPRAGRRPAPASRPRGGA